jgi:hypothetical protein
MAVVFAVMSAFVLAIPVVFLGIGYATPVVRLPMYGSAAFVLVLTAGTWLAGRPTRFEVSDDGLELVWPVWSRTVTRASITRARVVTKREVDEVMGGAVRVGVGGLFGVFGLLRTAKLGWVSCYITTIEPLVLIERSEGRSLLISPSQPEELVKLLSS